MNILGSVGAAFIFASIADSSWTEIPNLGGVIVESLTTAAGGGKVMYYDSIDNKIYFTTTNDSFTANQNMSWSMIDNAGRGYNLFGYDLATQTMFALPTPSPNSFSIGTYCDFITRIDGNLYVASTAFSSNIGVYNLVTPGVWSPLTSFTVNGRIQTIAYNSIANEIYLGGNFTSASTGSYITRYNLSTSTQSKIGCDGAGMVVSDMLFNPSNGYLYVATDTITNATVSGGGTVASLSGNGICIYDTNSGWLNLDLNIGS
jgi:hypothetical protein